MDVSHRGIEKVSLRPLGGLSGEARFSVAFVNAYE
jgi:hypothetical protein